MTTPVAAGTSRRNEDHFDTFLRTCERAGPKTFPIDPLHTLIGDQIAFDPSPATPKARKFVLDLQPLAQRLGVRYRTLHLASTY